MVRCRRVQNASSVARMTHHIRSASRPASPAVPASSPAGSAALSALDGWIDVCRTGTFTGLDGPVEFGAGDFDTMAEAFAGQDPVPVVQGHPDTDDPAMGRVAGLRRVGDPLQARLKDPAPAFRTAILEGRYGPRPICAVHDGTRWRLRHPGFPGASAPAVDGLTPARFARVADGRRVALSAPSPQFISCRLRKPSSQWKKSR